MYTGTGTGTGKACDRSEQWTEILSDLLRRAPNTSRLRTLVSILFVPLLELGGVRFSKGTLEYKLHVSPREMIP